MKFFNNLIQIKNKSKKVLSLLCVLFIGISIANAQNSTAEFVKDNDTIVVYKDVPGYNTVQERKLVSDKYSIRIRSAATNNEWVDVFANYTYNRSSEFVPQILDNGGQINYHYQIFTDQWSHTYGNIEMSRNTAVEVEIAFIISQIIFCLAAHFKNQTALLLVQKIEICFGSRNYKRIYFRSFIGFKK